MVLIHLQMIERFDELTKCQTSDGSMQIHVKLFITNESELLGTEIFLFILALNEGSEEI